MDVSKFLKICILIFVSFIGYISIIISKEDTIRKRIHKIVSKIKFKYFKVFMQKNISKLFRYAILEQYGYKLLSPRKSSFRKTSKVFTLKLVKQLKENFLNNDGFLLQSYKKITISVKYFKRS